MPGAVAFAEAVRPAAVTEIAVVQRISDMNDSTSFDSDNRRPSPFRTLSNIVSCSSSNEYPASFLNRFAQKRKKIKMDCGGI